ncbi:MAG: biotin/lipoyl-binding protein [Bacteroidia bacterium]|nr:biotin/lipoyl-binding protein [Bacteroidia bacterium]
MSGNSAHYRRLFSILLLAGLGLNACKKPEIEVQTGKAEVRSIFARVTESGTIQPTVEVPVAPDVSGEVVFIAVREGQKVKKGDLLLTIRPDDYRAQLEQAEASLNRTQAAYLQAQASEAQAESNYLQDSVSLARTQKLFKDQVVSQAELENAQLRFAVSRSNLEASKYNVRSAFYQVKSAEATRKQSRQNLDRTNIYASMDGTLTKLSVELGQRVVGTMQMAGTEILKIADLGSMEVVVEINENDIVNVSIGDSARVEVDAYAGKLFYGQVAEIAYSAKVAAGLQSSDQVTNFEVKVRIDPRSYAQEPSAKAGESPFRPGMTALVEIYTKQEPQALSIPIQAVTLRPKDGDSTAKAAPASPDANPNAGGEEVVFKLDGNGQVSKVKVVTGIRDDAYIHIQEGLQPGDEVVTGPFTVLSRTLKNGLAVKVQNNPQPAGGPKPQ